MSDDPERAQFSVYRFFLDGTCEAVERWITADRAARLARQVIAFPLPGAKRAAVRVIITNALDCLCWEWKRGEGVTDLTGETA